VKGYYEQVMAQLACSEKKCDTLIIWTNLGFIDLPIQFDEQYWCKSMLPKLKQFFETIVEEMVAHRLFISFYLPEDEFERLSSRSSFFSSVVSSMLVTVSAFSEMFESSCFFMCPVSISVTTMVSKNCPGLVTHREYPYIRASSDAIISCDCHGYNIIEIKCPYKARCMEPKQAVLESKID
jgi:hypothetical protein